MRLDECLEIKGRHLRIQIRDQHLLGGGAGQGAWCGVEGVGRGVKLIS